MKKNICHLVIFVVLGAVSAQAAITHGLLGRYYNEKNLTELVSTRVDTVVNFTDGDLGDAPPGTGLVADDEWSVRWTGYLYSDTTGTWRIYVNSNDGIRLWIDDELEIDEWVTRAETEDRAIARLEKGWHSVKLEYFQQGGSAAVQLNYRSPKQKSTAVLPSHLLSVYDPRAGVPFASAGADTFVVLPADSILLQGSAIDTNGVITDYAWTLLSGPSETQLTAPYNAECLVKGLIEGYYEFELIVTDNDGDQDTDHVGVTVAPAAGPAQISGDLHPWHTVQILFDGPPTSELAIPNPFFDYRLDVLFTGPGGQQYRVPGFYAADGNAFESSASSGRKWCVRFAPDQTGEWQFAASFVQGENIAAEQEGGKSAGYIDGETGRFDILPSETVAASDFRAKGKLEYVGGHYLQFAETKEYFLKGGTNSPEVFLEYEGFDNTPTERNYPLHVGHWNPGDPVWQDDKGKGIIGAVNYLSDLGQNVYYFLTMNAYGDGKKAWPFLHEDSLSRYDCSKLDQWEILFSHMTQKGIMPHFVLTETENEAYFEIKENGVAGGFATSRKVYYREMVARFGHHPAVTWNIGEENGWAEGTEYHIANTDEQRITASDYLRALIPYKDHISIHNGPSTDDGIFDALLGLESFTGPALQWNWGAAVHDKVLEWRNKSAAADHPWVVSMDEAWLSPETQSLAQWRHWMVWGSYMAGGAGIELYIGAGKDVTVQDFTPYAPYYRAMTLARNFFEQHLPFWEMESMDSLVTEVKSYCFAKPGESYVLYIPKGGRAELDLGDDAQVYRVSWYDPRNGGELQKSGVRQIQGPGKATLGPAPDSLDLDWTAIVSTVVSVAQDPAASEAIPESYALLPNFPNPFNPNTEIPYQLPEAEDVSIRIYNLQGQFIRDLQKGRQEAGHYSLSWNGKDASGQMVPSSVYLFKMKAGAFSQVRKGMLVK